MVLVVHYAIQEVLIEEFQLKWSVNVETVDPRVETRGRSSKFTFITTIVRMDIRDRT